MNKIEELIRGKSSISAPQPYIFRPNNALENLKENLAIGHEVLEEYSIGRVLGKGAHAVVRHATHKKS